MELVGCSIIEGMHFIFFKKYLFIYLAALGLSCGTQDLRCGMWDLLLWHVGFSLVVACSFSLSSCGTRAPERVGSVVVCGTRA